MPLGQCAGQKNAHLSEPKSHCLVAQRGSNGEAVGWPWSAARVRRRNPERSDGPQGQECWRRFWWRRLDSNQQPTDYESTEETYQTENTSVLLSKEADFGGLGHSSVIGQSWQWTLAQKITARRGRFPRAVMSGACLGKGSPDVRLSGMSIGQPQMGVCGRNHGGMCGRRR